MNEFKRYEKITSIIPLEQFKNAEVYLIEPYNEDIFAVSININNDNTIVQILDNNGNPFNKETQLEKSKILQKDIFKLTNLMININIKSSIFYYNQDNAIIEWLANNEFASYGMILDVIGKLIKVPAPLYHFILNDEKYNKLINGDYGNELIIKPSVLKTIIVDNKKIIFRTKYSKPNIN